MDAQACTIGLSINENLKLEKGKEKNSSAVRRFMRSLSHVSSHNYVHHNPPFSTSAVTLTLLLIISSKVFKPPSSLQTQHYARTIAAILLLSKVILSLYSYYAKEGLVCVALASPLS